MRWIRLTAVGLVFFVVSGCGDIFGPELPKGAVALDPLPPEYHGWWELTQQCSGLVGDLSNVRWFVLPGATTLPGKDGAVGNYDHRGNLVLLADGRERDGLLVRHEMLHALLRGVRGHPREQFTERCGGVVGCGGQCLEDARVPPVWDLTSPVVEPDELDVRVEVIPQVVRFPSEIHGCVSIAVSIENTRRVSVAVDVDRGRAFGWLLEGGGGGGGGGSILIDRFVVLPAGGSWTYTMDCPPRFRQSLEPGEYVIQGRVHHVTSAPTVMTVLP